MKQTKHKDELKQRVKSWMVSERVWKQRDALDVTIKETFFYIYNSMQSGENIQDIGDKLGVLPLP